MTSIPHLGLRLQERRFALPSLAVQELLQLPLVQATEGCHSSVLGLLNLRGAILPVIDLATAMGLPSQTADPAETLVVVQLPESAPPFALRVGFLEDQIDLAPPDEASSHGRIVAHHEAVYHLLDLKALGTQAISPREQGAPTGDLWTTTFGVLAADRMAVFSARAEALAALLDQEENSEEDYLVLELGGEHFALPAGGAHRIHPCPPLSPLPLSPPAFLGYGVYRGEAVLVADLRPLLGLSSPAIADGVAVVVEDQEGPLALFADRVVQVLRLDPSQLLPPLEDGASFLEGGWIRDDLPLSLINLDRLLAHPALAIPTPT